MKDAVFGRKDGPREATSARERSGFSVSNNLLVCIRGAGLMAAACCCHRALKFESKCCVVKLLDGHDLLSCCGNGFS